MKTRAQILEAVNAGKASSCFDGRDYARLIAFFPVDDWGTLGMKPKEGASPYSPKPLDEEHVLAQLKSDVEFGFEKALNKRGLSAGSMYEVVKMWMWVLDDPLQDFDDYPMYGLPLFKAVALKYGFENPIGDDTGSEDIYDEYA